MQSPRKVKAVTVGVFLLAWLVSFGFAAIGGDLSAPSLTNHPRLDTIVTNQRPLLSIFNSEGGTSPRTYLFQVDTTPTFDGPGLIEYLVPETPGADAEKIAKPPRVTSKRLEKGDELQDETTYYWRAKAIDATGTESAWGTEAGGMTARFIVDLSSDDVFSGLIRTPITEVTTSPGMDSQNIADPGGYAAAETYWIGYSSQNRHWIKFDLGEPEAVSTIWMLSRRMEISGRPQDFVWQYSASGDSWTDIEETRTKDADGLRHLLEIEPVTARYFRLLITGWHGPAPVINEILLYSPGTPSLPNIPNDPYVLVVGNGFTGTGGSNVLNMVKGAGLGLETLYVPYYEVSMEMLRKLDPQPVAIITSGFGRWYETIPMFEFNGEYEIIRQEANIPLLGICGGHQLLVMAYGYTFARDMGRGFYTRSVEYLTEDFYPIHIEIDDPIFDGMPNPFYGPEYHGWDVVVLQDDEEDVYLSLAVSDWMGNEIIKHKDRMVYGEQFHGERNQPFNVARMFQINFLRMALDR